MNFRFLFLFILTNENRFLCRFLSAKPGVNTSLNPSLRGASYATWQSHQPAPSLRGAQRRGNLIL
jgi:hypothetical protein